MTDYYVDAATGNDANAGTSEGAGNAWLTIQKAVDTVIAGDTAYIKGGTSYLEEVDFAARTIGTVAAPVRFIGYTTTITDEGRFVVDAESTRSRCFTNLPTGDNFWQFRNFRVTGATVQNVNFNNADYISFHNFRCDNAGGVGIDIDNSCIFTKFQLDSNASHGVDADSSTRCVGFEAFGNGGDQIKVNGGFVGFGRISGMTAGTNGVTAKSSNANYTVANVTIDGEGGLTTVGLNAIAAQGGQLYMNNSLYDLATGIAFAAASGAGSRYFLSNHFQGNTADFLNCAGGIGSITGAPLFTNEAGSDYTLQATSPLLSAGLDAGAANGTSYIDIGGFQRVGPVVADTIPPSPAPEGTFTVSGSAITVTYTNNGEASASRYLAVRPLISPSGGAWTEFGPAASVSAGETLVATGLTEGVFYETFLIDRDAALNNTIEGSFGSSKTVQTGTQTDRERIHNALILMGQQGVFRPVSHHNLTDIVTIDGSSTVVPAEVLTNETSSKFDLTQRRRRQRGRERGEWLWSLVLGFNEEVCFEEFEETNSLVPTLLARDTDHSRQVTIDLTGVEYLHPPRQDPENGSRAVFTFNARVSPV